MVVSQSLMRACVGEDLSGRVFAGPVCVAPRSDCAPVKFWTRDQRARRWQCSGQPESPIFCRESLKDGPGKSLRNSGISNGKNPFSFDTGRIGFRPFESDAATPEASELRLKGQGGSGCRGHCPQCVL